jgi:hypothetical protein
VLGTLGLLVSNGGVGKSFFLLMLAISIATGIPFMDDLYTIGFHGYGAVLIIFGEDPEVVIHTRLRKIVHAMYPPAQYSEDLEYITNSLNKNLFVISSTGEDTRLIKNVNGKRPSGGLMNGAGRCCQAKKPMKSVSNCLNSWKAKPQRARVVRSIQLP